MKTSLYLLALGGLVAAPMLSLTSCNSIMSAVASAREVDLSKFPGLSNLQKEQEEMMAIYAESSRLLLSSQEAALDALQKDAEALQNSLQAGEAYDKAAKIAKATKARLDEIHDQLAVLVQKPDLDALQIAVELSNSTSKLCTDGYNKLAGIQAAGNAAIAKTNKQGDKLVMQAYQHLEEATANINKSYSLLQKARLAEVKLTGVAAAQSADLIKSLEGAGNMDKAGLALQFRPIIYFLTGLPDEIDQQASIASMWEQHAKDSNIKLPVVKIPSISDSTKKVSEKLTKAVGSLL